MWMMLSAHMAPYIYIYICPERPFTGTKVLRPLWINTISFIKYTYMQCDVTNNITWHIVFDIPVSTIHLWLGHLLREAILRSAPTSCCNAVSEAEKSWFTAWRGKIVAWWKTPLVCRCWWDIYRSKSLRFGHLVPIPRPLCPVSYSRRWKLRFCYHLCSIYDAPTGLCCIPGWGNKMDLFSTSRSRGLPSTFEGGTFFMIGHFRFTNTTMRDT